MRRLGDIGSIGSALAIVIIVLLLLICASIFIIVYKNKINFLKKYKITELPKSIKVRKRRKSGERNYFILKYPYWEISKKDGTADLRVAENVIVWQISELYVDGFVIASEKPYELLDVIKKLRANNVKIDLCKDEKRKYFELLNKRELYIQNVSIQKIIDYYKDKSAGFEKFCAKLYSKMGYRTEVTPPTNDGGYDIVIAEGKTTGIVECKCYSMDNKVGRPVVQKLVGANIMGADKMIFITTSEFSTAAISYAESAGVELIDGNKLLQLVKKYMSIEIPKASVSVSECQLEIADMKPYVPSDIFEDYFL